MAVPNRFSVDVGPVERELLDFNYQFSIDYTTAVIGYPAGIGHGGSVTQITSKATAVTLNTQSGRVIMINAALGAGASINFTLSNTFIQQNSVLCLNPLNFNGYRVEVETVAANAASIRVTNVTAGILSDALQILFAVFNAQLS